MLHLACLSWRRSLLLGCWALFALLLAAHTAHAQTPVLQYAAPAGSDARRPIQLMADDIVTWQEDGIRMFVLEGRVLVSQSPVSARMQRAVVWVDEAGQKKDGTYRLKVVGTGVELTDAIKKQESTQAVLDLATRGEISLKAYVSKVTEKNLSGSDVYKSAFKLAKNINKSTPTVAAPPEKTTTAPSVPSKSEKPALLPTLSPVPMETKKSDINAGKIQLVQAVAPDPTPTLPGASITPPSPATGPIVPGPSLPLPPRDQPARQLTIRPRSSQEIQARNFPQANGEVAVVITSGIILTVTTVADKKTLLDIEADRLVLWTRGESGELINSLRSTSGKTSDSLEFYLSGNVEIRTQGATGAEAQILRADEVYYDVGRGVAVAMRADLEMNKPGLKNPVHMQAEEIIQLNPKLFVGKRSQVYSSAIPSDPGLKVELVETVVEEKDVEKRSVFGRPYINPETGKPRVEKEHYFTGRNLLLRLEGIPIFYFPYLKGNVEDPFGPLENLNIGSNRIFGFQLQTTWSMFELLGLDRPDNTRWNLLADYLSRRGPALGTVFETAGRDLFGIKNNFALSTRAYGIHDTGVDILGGNRGESILIDPMTAVKVDHPDFRGRWLSRMNITELPYGFQVQGQLGLISDRNFLEQYFPQEWLNDLNQETYLYAKQQNENWAWTILGEVRLRDWITETEWLPRADGYLLGEKLFNTFTYNTHASAGYARLRPSEEPGFPYLATDKRLDTARFDWSNELSLPIQLGPIRTVPYLVGDLTYYTQDLNGDGTGRFYGGGGVRSSMPLSRLYPGVESDIFNLDGLYHKILFYSNIYAAESTVSYTRLPQLDRLNDDASDQALRNIRPYQTAINPKYGASLTTSPLFDPQSYAIRRLVDSRIDTRDDIQVVQMGVNQRWQTRRGLPGNQHVVDWMTLDVRGSFFPRADRDNFGESFGILEYDWVWNIGDRTALTSSGWLEPFDNGPRVFNLGAYLGRPDATNLYLGYRHIDPLESRALVGSLTYPMSAKYAFTGASVWDFGVDQLNHSLVLTRMGTDLMVSFGVTYNSTLSTFGVTFEVLPVLLPSRYRTGGFGANTGLAGIGR